MTDGQMVDPILVIDDDPECCAITADILERAGYRVEWTIDAAFALPRIRERRYAVVVSDIDMPRMAGTALAVEAMQVVPRVPTVLVSGRIDGATRIAARALGARLLVKPFGREALLSAVADLVPPRPPAAAA
jgi:chemosensory pili system protein ChpA (sensor histidine kinase/response regulator)